LRHDLDWYSRFVVSWELSDTLEIGFVLTAVERALSVARLEIWNSDQGSHFTSPQYIARLEAAQVRISMDGKGRALDNIKTSRLWRMVKYEEVYLHEYAGPRDARHGLTRYLEFYNQERPHQSLAYLQSTATAIEHFHLSSPSPQTTGEPCRVRVSYACFHRREQQWVMPLAVLWSGSRPGLNQTPS